jgi:hypothetical protein
MVAMAIRQREDERRQRRFVAQDDAEPDGDAASVAGGDGRFDDLDLVAGRAPGHGPGRGAGEARRRCLADLDIGGRPGGTPRLPGEKRLEGIAAAGSGPGAGWRSRGPRWSGRAPPAPRPPR